MTITIVSRARGGHALWKALDQALPERASAGWWPGQALSSPPIT
ncbi:MAG TPA: hypothetical protein VEK82_06065 [Stellaceae bacterium]|nr:hypothetical protein [Stellaceae bacterium]